MVRAVPLRSLQVDPVDVAALIRFLPQLADYSVVDDLNLKVYHLELLLHEPGVVDLLRSEEHLRNKKSLESKNAIVRNNFFFFFWG